MKTIGLGGEGITIQEVLRWADGDVVLIRDGNGKEFILEEADAFEREVAELGASKEFMRFLAERSKEPASISLDEIERDLESQEH
ncbi:MAG: hypothetical protein HY321_00610 [Armatimonadetes bacterium]|nr:hypothetical protein [Armatimonadota bacterium]